MSSISEKCLCSMVKIEISHKYFGNTSIEARFTCGSNVGTYTYITFGV